MAEERVAALCLHLCAPGVRGMDTQSRQGVGVGGGGTPRCLPQDLSPNPSTAGSGHTPISLTLGGLLPMSPPANTGSFEIPVSAVLPVNVRWQVTDVGSGCWAEVVPRFACHWVHQVRTLQCTQGDASSLMNWRIGIKGVRVGHTTTWAQRSNMRKHIESKEWRYRFQRQAL